MPSKPAHSTVAITGANGFVGQALTDHFVRKGWRVIALVRHPKTQPKKQHVLYVAYDLTQPVKPDMLQGVDFLIHTAYTPYDRNHPDALAINLAGAERLLHAARAARVSHTVFFSTMSAHDDAVSIYGKQKLAIEKLFNTKSDTVLRCGLIMGDGGIVKKMIGFMKSKHVVPLIDGGQQPLQVISIFDLAEVVECVIVKKLSGVFTVACPEVYSYRTLYQTIARRLHIKIVFIPVPFTVLLAGMRIISALHLPLSVNEDNLWGLKKLRAVNNRRDMQRIGVSPASLTAILDTPGIIRDDRMV